MMAPTSRRLTTVYRAGRHFNSRPRCRRGKRQAYQFALLAQDMIELRANLRALAEHPHLRLEQAVLWSAARQHQLQLFALGNLVPVGEDQAGSQFCEKPVVP